MNMKLTSLVEELKSSRHYTPKNNNEIGINIIPNYMRQTAIYLADHLRGTGIQVTEMYRLG
jgi:hypothetical protein